MPNDRNTSTLLVQNLKGDAAECHGSSTVVVPYRRNMLHPDRGTAQAHFRLFVHLRRLRTQAIWPISVQGPGAAGRRQEQLHKNDFVSLITL